MANKKNQSKIIELISKIHILDIFFVLMVVAIIGVVVIKLSLPREDTVIGTSELLGSKSKMTVEMTMITEPYEVVVLDNIHEMAQLVELKEYMDGEILSVEIVDYLITKVDNNGTVVTGPHPFLKQAIVIARAAVTYKEPTYKFGTVGITENKEFHLNTDRVKLKTIITDISVISN